VSVADFFHPFGLWMDGIEGGQGVGGVGATDGAGI
jgi:hypothetical protein